MSGHFYKLLKYTGYGPNLTFTAFYITNALGSQVKIGFEQSWGSLSHYRKDGSSCSRSPGLCFHEADMVFGCMLAKKESQGKKKKLLLGSLPVASLFILAGVYM